MNRWMTIRRAALAALTTATVASSALAQDFAPAQPRAAIPTAMIPSEAPPEVLEPPDRLRSAMALTRTDIALPVPLGLGGGGSGVEVFSGRFLTGGSLVGLPSSAAGTGARLYTFRNANGGLNSVMYNPGTGATVVYNQSSSFGLGRAPNTSGGFTSVTTQPGTGAFSGLTTNPSFGLNPRLVNPNPGIPAINAGSPSYDFRSNLGLGSPSSGSSPSFGLGVGGGSSFGGGGASSPSSFGLGGRP